MGLQTKCSHWSLIIENIVLYIKWLLLLCFVKVRSLIVRFNLSLGIVDFLACFTNLKHAKRKKKRRRRQTRDILWFKVNCCVNFNTTHLILAKGNGYVTISHSIFQQLQCAISSIPISIAKYLRVCDNWNSKPPTKLTVSRARTRMYKQNPSYTFSISWSSDKSLFIHL